MNTRELSNRGALAACKENGFDNEHDFKDYHECGKSRYNMCVDIDSDEIILESLEGWPNVDTGLYTSQR